MGQYLELMTNHIRDDQCKENRAARKKATKKAWKVRNKRKRSRAGRWNEGR